MPQCFYRASETDPICEITTARGYAEAGASAVINEVLGGGAGVTC